MDKFLYIMEFISTEQAYCQESIRLNGLDNFKKGFADLVFVIIMSESILPFV